MSDLHLSDKLHVIRMVDDGITPQAVANQFDVTVDKVLSIMQTRHTLESMDKSPSKRFNLSLGDKLRVIHMMDIHKNQTTVGRICKIHRRTVKNVLDKRESILSADIKGIPTNVKRPLKAKYLAVDNAVIDFINFARSQRLPVTSSHVQACALKAAKQHNIPSFSASNGWLHRFLRRSPVQPSFKFHGKGGTALPV